QLSPFQNFISFNFPFQALAYTLPGGWDSLPAIRDASRGVEMTTINRTVVAHSLLFFALGAVPFAARAETGLAAVYSHRLDGHKTASGKIYKPSGMTVAHKSL